MRDKTLFEEEVENIQSVSIEYPKQRSQSFILEDTPTVMPSGCSTTLPETRYLQRAAEAFLSTSPKA